MNQSSSADALNIVVAAGGTGGHIYPGLAVGHALADLGVNVRFMGTPKGLESQLIPPHGFPLDLVPAAPLKKSVGALVRFPFALVGAIVASYRLLGRHKINAVVGMGGYASIPVVVAARLRRIPALIHESGAVPGRANLIAAKLCKRVAVSFPVALSSFSPKAETRVTGMPLSGAILSFDRDVLHADARKTLELRPDSFVVFATGGSQGSATINNAALDLAQRWKDNDKFEIVLKAGKSHRAEIAKKLEANGPFPNLHIVDFFERMQDPYAAADAAVTRAGAGTVAEIEIVALPSVFVPYPFAPDDHQAVNASVLIERKAAILIRDPQANAEHIGPFMEELQANPEHLAQMRAAAQRDAHRHAAAEVAKWATEIAR